MGCGRYVSTPTAGMGCGRYASPRRGRLEPWPERQVVPSTAPSVTNPGYLTTKAPLTPLPRVPVPLRLRPLCGQTADRMVMVTVRVAADRVTVPVAGSIAPTVAPVRLAPAAPASQTDAPGRSERATAR